MAFPRRSTSNNAIGSPITNATDGSVLFVGSGAVLAQDNTHLNWDDTNNLLTMQSGSAGKPAVQIGASPTGEGYAEVVSTDDMHTLTYALRVRARDDGGGATGAFGGARIEARSQHASGTLTEINGLEINTDTSLATQATTTARGAQITMSLTSSVVDAIGLDVHNITSGTNNYAIKTGSGQVSFGDVVRVPGVVIGSLPSSPLVGMIMRVTDSLTPVLGATVSAGGSAPALVWYNGTNWTVIGK